ncbi:MAG TPA: PadR family transcriptional regulator [Dehalococcoidia bacterium]|nr:PadR family transcriptional regulator [Dehalococcoidia bacterium]
MKYALLALLAQGPAHGYELKQSFESRFGAVWPPVNIGQVYSTLQRLERDHLVRGREVEQAGRPPKHVFEITEAGLAALSEWLRETSTGARIRDEFFMKLVLAGMAGIEDPMLLIQRQRERFLQELRALNEVAISLGGAQKVASLLVEGASLHIQADLKWLDLWEDSIREGVTL